MTPMRWVMVVWFLIIIGLGIFVLMGCIPKDPSINVYTTNPNQPPLPPTPPPPQQHCETLVVTGIGRCIPNYQLCGSLPWCETVWNYNTLTVTCGPVVGQQRQVCR